MKKLGDKITVVSTLNRIKERGKVDWLELKCLKPLEGIVVGVRTVKEGIVEVEHDTYEGRKIVHKYFVPSKHIKCYIVAINLRDNPLHVPINDENI